jgi:Prokaryotic homologs of the JAB domain
MIALAPEVLELSFQHLRRCGAGQRECVVFWAGPLSEPGRVDQVLHPRHTASVGGYEVDPTWISELWLDLARERQTVRVQVHTHPGATFHSSTDDDFALVHTPGYMSLVIPDFAGGAVGLKGSYLTARAADGNWNELDPHAEIEVRS